MISNIKHLFDFFHFDALALIMTCLIVFLGLVITCFSNRYLKFDTHRKKFFLVLLCLIISTVGMVSADNIILFLIFHCFSNLALAVLMVHNPNWSAARNSGILAAKNLLLAPLFLLFAFSGLYLITQTTSIQEIMQSSVRSPYYLLCIGFVVLSAMVQSCIFPFHRWLMSSLNSPTPVSAVMHAGVINGGGFILIRFASLYINIPTVLTCIFLLGLGTALLGTLLKLIQHDVKRMLACSTIGQMGFMFMQCGLGLLPNAVVHLCFHGFFKAYLFLGHATLALDKERGQLGSVGFLGFLFSILFGILGSLCFAFASQNPWLSSDTTLIQNFIAGIFCTQLSLCLIKPSRIMSYFNILLLSCIVGYVYGFITYIFEGLLNSSGLMQPQALSGFHVLGIICLFVPWLIMRLPKIRDLGKLTFVQSLYVTLLNHSQPSPKTITAIRQNYQFN